MYSNDIVATNYMYMHLHKAKPRCAHAHSGSVCLHVFVCLCLPNQSHQSCPEFGRSEHSVHEVMPQWNIIITTEYYFNHIRNH